MFFPFPIIFVHKLFSPSNKDTFPIHFNYLILMPATPTLVLMVNITNISQKCFPQNTKDVATLFNTELHTNYCQSTSVNQKGTNFP